MKSETRVSNALSSRAVARRVLSALRSLTTVFGMRTGGPSALKSLTVIRFALCQHRPIFPGSLPPSIVGTAELNYRVRNGNGWTLRAKDTDCYGAPSGTSFAALDAPWSSAALTTVQVVIHYRLFRAPSGPSLWCTFGDSNPGPTD